MSTLVCRRCLVATCCQLKLNLHLQPQLKLHFARPTRDPNGDLCLHAEMDIPVKEDGKNRAKGKFPKPHLANEQSGLLDLHL